MTASILRGPTSLLVAAMLLIGCASTSTAPNASPASSAGASPASSTSPSPIPAASSSTEPSVAPTPAPTATPRPTPAGSIGTRFNVELALSTGRTVQIEIKDDSGTLTEAVSGTPSDGASVAEGILQVRNGGANVLQLTWSGPPCATDNFLLIEGGASRMTVVQPSCAGDAIALDRVLVLTFADPVAAGTVDAILQAGGDTPA